MLCHDSLSLTSTSCWSYRGRNRIRNPHLRSVPKQLKWQIHAYSESAPQDMCDYITGCWKLNRIMHRELGVSKFPVLPLPLSFARSRESWGRPNSHFDRGVGLRGRGRYHLKPSIFASLLETKGYPEHTAARSSRGSHKCKYFRLK